MQAAPSTTANEFWDEGFGPHTHAVRTCTKGQSTNAPLPCQSRGDGKKLCLWRLSEAQGHLTGRHSLPDLPGGEDGGGVPSYLPSLSPPSRARGHPQRHSADARRKTFSVACSVDINNSKCGSSGRPAPERGLQERRRRLTSESEGDARRRGSRCDGKKASPAAPRVTDQLGRYPVRRGARQPAGGRARNRRRPCRRAATPPAPWKGRRRPLA